MPGLLATMKLQPDKLLDGLKTALNDDLGMRIK
jgi:hypothetical protein